MKPVTAFGILRDDGGASGKASLRGFEDSIDIDSAQFAAIRSSLHALPFLDSIDAAYIMTTVTLQTCRVPGDTVVVSAENVSIGQKLVRSEAAIQSTIRKETPRIMKYYEWALHDMPNLCGRIEVRFRIPIHGRVERVTVLSSTLNNTEFEQGLVDLIREWHFGRVEEGVLDIKLPFVFEGCRVGDRARTRGRE